MVSVQGTILGQQILMDTNMDVPATNLFLALVLGCYMKIILNSDYSYGIFKTVAAVVTVPFLLKSLGTMKVIFNCKLTIKSYFGKYWDATNRI